MTLSLEKKQNLMEVKLIPELNSLAEFIVRISNDVPFLYGAFAIILAVVLGALMAWFRKIIHDLRHKKPKQENNYFLL